MIPTRRVVVYDGLAPALIGAGLFLFGAAVYERPYAELACSHELLNVSAGADCESPQQASLNCCIECQSNGNNGFVRCAQYPMCQKCATYQSDTECIQCADNPNPAQCQGNIITYTNLADCQNNVNGKPGTQCLRTYPVVIGAGPCNEQGKTCP